MKHMRKILCVALAIVMLLGMLPAASAVETGLVYAADDAAWGTQGNNGWYYMYRLEDGTYHEMNFYDSTSSISWQQNAFASDPTAMGEMFFITKNTCFVGENGSRPVYAYKAPASGQLQLTMQTHSTSEMHMQVSVGDEVQSIDGQDSLTLCTTGSLAGGMTKTTLLMDVQKDDMVYVEFYSTDTSVQRQAWINEYSMTYLSIDKDYTGETLAPDMSAWGTQNNNSWYWMYQDASGELREMSYYDSTASIDWQQNAFASDPSTALEMYFINQTIFFLGENGTLPVYAFKAPQGGEIELTFETHGVSDLYAQVLVGGEVQKIGESDRVTFTTDGPLEGAYSETKLTLQVKKNTVVAIVPGSTDTSLANRGGYLRNYSVQYISTNNEVDYTSAAYSPDLSAWGTQGNNGWYWMYQDGNLGTYSMLDFYDSTATIDWQKNNFAFDPYSMGEMLFIDQIHFFTGECGSKPVYAFKAPVSGEVKFYFEIHGQNAMGLSAYLDDQLVQINGQDRLTFCTTGSLAGAHTGVSLTVKMKKGQTMYFVCSSTDTAVRDGWFRNQSAKYLSVSDDVDYTKLTLTPDMDQWGTDENNCWSYAYRNAMGDYNSLTYYAADATTIDWQKDTYSFDPNEMVEMLFISKSIFFVGENGSRPAYVFTAPIGGEVEFTVNTHGVAQLYMEVYQGNDLVKVNGQDRISFTTTGTLAGGFTKNTFTVNVKKGSKVYLLGGSDDISVQRGGYVNYYAAKYLSVNDEEEEPIVITKPKVEGAAAEWNKTTDYYAALQQKLASDEPMTWLFVGDSITANDGDVTKGYRCYAEIFESYLKSTLGRVNDRVVNTAVSGWKIRNVNYETDIAAYNPDVVFVALGTNDNFLTDFAANNFYAGMSTLYDKIVDAGMIPVVVCSNGFSNNWGNTEQTAAFAERYPNAIRTLAYEKNLLLADFFSAYAEDKDYADSHYFNPDTIHPNRNGMLKMAQTLITDLGMEQESSILSQNAGDLSDCETTQMILPGLDYADYITDGTVVKLADIDLSKTFTLTGNGNAIGASKELITFRSIGQYLNNNLQLGRCITASFCEDLPLTEDSKILLMMAEPETLFAKLTDTKLESSFKALIEDGYSIVLITPAPSAEDDNGETKALAEKTRSIAEKVGCPLIDLYAYLTDCFEKEPAAADLWYDAEGLLNYAGTNEAALLIGTAFGMDIVKMSDNNYTEDLTPEAWGTQGINGFTYLYQSKETGEYSELPYISKENADASWTADRYSLAANDFTFIGKDVLHAGAQYNVVKAFTVPYSGKVAVSLKHRRGVNDVTEGGENGTMWIKAFLNDESKDFDDGDTAVRMLAASGCYTQDRLTLDVTAGDVIYIVVDAEQPGQADLIETVTYLSLTQEICVHDYVLDTENSSAPSCTTPGKNVYVCSKCSDSYEENVEALGHDFAEGVCTRCGAVDPDYVAKDPCEGYTDIDRNSWYHTAADFVIKNGYMGSTKTDKLTFEPTTKVSRAMVASIMYRIAGAPAVTYKASFTDVSAGKWFTNAIEWAAQEGLASGKGNGKFDPNGNVTRQELAIFMYKLAEYLGQDVSGRADLSKFSDEAKVPSWAKTYVQWAVSAGLISGKGSGSSVSLAPVDNATRAEFASIIMRFMSKA